MNQLEMERRTGRIEHLYKDVAGDLTILRRKQRKHKRVKIRFEHLVSAWLATCNRQPV